MYAQSTNCVIFYIHFSVIQESGNLIVPWSNTQYLKNKAVNNSKFATNAIADTTTTLTITESTSDKSFPVFCADAF